MGGGGQSQRSLICRGRWGVEGRVEDTQRSCIPIDTEEGFLLQPCKDGRERESVEREGGRRREHHISAMLSQHVNAMHVLIELEIFRGHVVMGSYGLKLSPKQQRVCLCVC